MEHIENPYINDQSKLKLSKMTGLGSKQISTWFMNARKRFWHPIKNKKRKRKYKNPILIFC
jgi:hypothetical protein